MQSIAVVDSVIKCITLSLILTEISDIGKIKNANVISRFIFLPDLWFSFCYILLPMIKNAIVAKTTFQLNISNGTDQSVVAAIRGNEGLSLKGLCIMLVIMLLQCRHALALMHIFKHLET